MNEYENMLDQMVDKKKPEPIFKLTKKQLRIEDPKSIDKKYFKEFELRLDNASVSINNLDINLQSPKTRQAMQTCNLVDSQIIVEPKSAFRLPGDIYAAERHKIHLYQVAIHRKQLIFERNKLKKEEWVQKRTQQKQISQPNLDHSVSSIQISEYAPYKSPTELIESWIENHVQQSDKMTQRFVEIQKKQKEEEVEHQQEQDKYKEEIQEIFVQKAKRREQKLKEKQKIAKDYNSKSYETAQKMKLSMEEHIKQQMLRNQQSQQHSESVKRKLEEMRQKQISQLEEKQKIYEEKLRKVMEKKKSQDQHIMLTRLESLNSERSSQQFKKKESKTEQLSMRLPKLNRQQQKMAILDSIEQENLAYVLEKFKKSNKNNHSVMSSSELDESQVKKLDEIQRRYQEKLKKFEDRGLEVQKSLEKQDQHLTEFSEQRRNQLEEKFERIKEITNNNENRFGNILKQYSEKCDRQMNNEISKFKKNIRLIKQRDKVIEKIKHKQFMEKSKSVISLSSSQLNEQKRKNI